MVSTRRGACASAPEVELASNAKKPALRKAAAATKKAAASTKATTSKTAPARTRTTRAEQINEPQNDVEREEAHATRQAPRSLPSRATRATKSSAAKSKPETETDNTVTIAKPTTRGGRGRTRKEAVLRDDVPELSSKAQPRPTRSTRTTASKPTPLSPKKITQVSRPSSREEPVGKIAKAAAKKVAPVASTTRSRANSRKQKESDENEGVQTWQDEKEVKLKDSTEMPQATITPRKSKAARSRGAAKEEAGESDMGIDSGSSTPDACSTIALHRTQNQYCDVPEQDEPSYNNVSGDVTDDASVPLEPDGDAHISEDEICGPKTPMKRPKVERKIQWTVSPQRAIQPLRTPARNFVVMREQHGTPQTQRPIKATLDATYDVSMSVSRVDRGSFVFRRLRPMKEVDNEDPSDLEPSRNTVQDEGEFGSAAYSTSNNGEANDEGSATTLSNAMDSVDQECLAEETHLDASQSKSTILLFDRPAEEPSFHLGGLEHLEESAYASELHSTYEAQPFEASEAMDDDSDTSESSDCYAEDSIQHGQSIIDLSQTGIGAPETIPWDSVREDMTIPVDLDIHLSGGVVLPQTTPTERLSINADTILAASAVSHEQSSSLEPADASEDEVGEDVDEDMTLHVSEFINEDAMGCAAQPSPMKVTNDNDMDVTGLVHECHTEDAEATVFENDIDVTGLIADAGRVSPMASCSSRAAQSVVDVVHQDDGEITPRSQSASHIELDIDVTGLCQTPSRTTTSSSPHIPLLPQGLDVTGILEDQDSPLELPEHLSHDSNDESLTSPLPHYELQSPSRSAVLAVEDEETAIEVGEDVPRYARPTTSSRRKSLPAFGNKTPVQSPSRPNTSAGASVPRRFANWEEPWWIRSRKEAQVAQAAEAQSLFRRSSMSQDITGSIRPATPARSIFAPSVVGTPATRMSERFPRRQSKISFEQHLQTARPTIRHRTPERFSAQRPATVARLGRGRYLSKDPQTPSKKRRLSEASFTPEIRTSQKKLRERYPRLGGRPNYTALSATVAAPTRFRTPLRSTQVRRAETVRKVAIKDEPTIWGSNTPMRTPLKAVMPTPGHQLLTPHPAAPLRRVVALVEVFTNDGASASTPFIQLLHRLGAKTTKTFSERVTHVVFKNGSATTLQRVRLHNKEVEVDGKGNKIQCVNSRWVSDCEDRGSRVDELDERYVVDVEEAPRGGKRKRKSMEPFALQNINGNIVRDRNSSYGRNSLGRNSLGRVSLGRTSVESHANRYTPNKKTRFSDEATEVQQTEDADIAGEGFESPTTPAWIGAPDQLVQQTAPQNRIRKLQIKGGSRGNRRLTFWNGA